MTHHPPRRREQGKETVAFYTVRLYNEEETSEEG